MRNSYLPIDIYEARVVDSLSSLHKDFIAFQHSDELHYFAWLKGGKVLLQGAGYSTPSLRDIAIKDVLICKGDRNNYRTETIRNEHFLILLGSDGHELARSYSMQEEIETFVELNSIISTHDATTDDSFSDHIDPTNQREQTDIDVNHSHQQNEVEDTIASLITEKSVKVVNSPLLDSFTSHTSNEHANLEKNIPDDKGSKKDNILDKQENSIEKPESIERKVLVNKEKPNLAKDEEKKKMADALYTLKHSEQPNQLSQKDQPTASKKRNYGRWALWLVLISMMGGLLWWLIQLKGYEKVQLLTARFIASTAKDHKPKANIKSDTLSMANTIQEAKARWESTLGGMVNIYLPDGSKLTVPEFGTEKKLVEYLEAKCGTSEIKKTWFDMDRILFKSGTDELSEISDEQITLLAKIFKSYPNKKFKIGGYTDNIGNPEDNIRLSAIRAGAAMRAIAAKGIDSTRMRFEGYGQEHPLCPENDTEECRAKNRRVAIRVDVCK